MECSKHTGETVIMVCKSCLKYPLLCGVCIEEDHTEHKLQTLRNASQSIRQHFEQVETDKLEVFEEIKSDLVNISELRKECHQESSRVGEEIVKHVGVIKGEVDKVNEEVDQKRKTELDKNMAAIDKTEQALTQQVSRIEMFQKKVAEIQKTNDYVEVIMADRDVEVPDTAPVPRPDIQRLEFKPGTINVRQLGRMFGTVAGDGDHIDTCDGKTEKGDEKANTSSDFVGSIKRELNVNISSVNSFRHSQKDGLRYMFCQEPELCFLKCEMKNSIKLSDSSGRIRQCINLGTTTNGFTVTTDNRLLFCCVDQKCVKEMQLPNGEITEKINTSPLEPKCICTGPSGDIYVTLCDDNEYTRALARYDKWGQQKTRRKKDGFGRNIFVLPLYVCVNSTNTQVAVINRTNDRRTEMVLFNGELSPELIYKGPSVLTGNTMEGFALTGVMFDSRDNIIVTESFSHTVQLLSPYCEPLKTLLVIDARPWALALDGDKVWVGDSEGNVHIFRYSY